MSYHTHNLKVGDEFWDTKELDQNTKSPWYWWIVIYVDHGTDDTYIQAQSMESDDRIDGFFNRDISLCMRD